MAALQFVHPWKRTQAGLTPGGPEIDQHYLASVLFEQGPVLEALDAPRLTGADGAGRSQGGENQRYDQQGP